MKHFESVKRIIILQLAVVGLLMQTMAYVYVWRTVYNDIMQKYMWRNFTGKGFWLLAAVYLVLLLFFTGTYGGLKIGYLKPMDVFFSQVLSLLFVNAISYFQISLLSLKMVTAYPLVIMTLVQTGIAAVWVFICQSFYRQLFPPRKLLLISGNRPIEDILHKFESREDKYEVVKCMREDAGQQALEKEILERYDGIVLWDINTGLRNKLLKFCYSRSIRVYMMPKIPDIMIQGASQLHLFDTPILFTREYSMTVEQRFVKRAIDIICSLILIIITSPIMLITAVIIKCYDHGPVLYKQVRCTRNMQEFKILKFRSMRTDAEKDGVARLASKNDNRITPVGKFIRKVRIDELPQLFNILKGDMSLVGPRPERPFFVEKFKEEIPRYMIKHQVRPGMTGWAQVNGYRGDTSIRKRIEHDLYYIENWTLGLDVKILFLTVFKGFINKNAY